MAEREWDETYASLEYTIKGLNAMTDEEFSEQVQHWEKRNLSRMLRRLKNCDQLMSLIDMIQENKFKILEERFGKEFVLNKCERLDSVGHSIMWFFTGGQPIFGRKGAHQDMKEGGRRHLNSVPFNVRPTIRSHDRKLSTVPRDVRPINLTPTSLGRKLHGQKNHHSHAHDELANNKYGQETSYHNSDAYSTERGHRSFAKRIMRVSFVTFLASLGIFMFLLKRTVAYMTAY